MMEEHPPTLTKYDVGTKYILICIMILYLHCKSLLLLCPHIRNGLRSRPGPRFRTCTCIPDLSTLVRWPSAEPPVEDHLKTDNTPCWFSIAKIDSRSRSTPKLTLFQAAPADNCGRLSCVHRSARWQTYWVHLFIKLHWFIQSQERDIVVLKLKYNIGYRTK